MVTSRLIPLKRALIEESLLVQAMIEKGFEGILEKNLEKLEEVKRLETIVNSQEIEIEKLCLQMIALHHPEGTNLRMILMITKINNDLERIGDLAYDIACCTEAIIDYPLMRSFADLGQMAHEILKMLVNAMRSFIDGNSELSLEVCRHDNIVDKLYKKIYGRLIDDAMPNSLSRRNAFYINKIARNYERIADLATNIAEYNVFIVNGTVIKRDLSDFVFEPIELQQDFV